MTVKHLDTPWIHIPKKEFSPHYAGTLNKSTVSPYTTDQKIIQHSQPPCPYVIQQAMCLRGSVVFPTSTVTMTFNVKVCQDKLKG